ncbi:MAG TPA: patatin-like phospholipase family protein [Patescibacteria group bacterium]|nr:patatin-like phospholipase family protein [Patescibacteria group bacterium]
MKQFSIFKKHKKLGLALGSGGAKGLVHIGIIKVLEENDIKIDYIAGTSIGSLVGGMYAHFGKISPVEEFFMNLGYKTLLGLFSDPVMRSGLLKGEKLVKYLDDFLGGAKIEDTIVPFKAVATDMVTADPVVLSKGNLAEAARASGSVPIAFTPYKIGNKFLVDGGLSLSVPVSVVKEMGAQVVLAVNLDSVFFAPKNRVKNPAKIHAISFINEIPDMLRYNLAAENCRNADIVIEPKIPDVGWEKFAKGGDLIKAGEREARKVLQEIKKAIR